MQKRLRQYGLMSLMSLTLLLSSTTIASADTYYQSNNGDETNGQTVVNSQTTSEVQPSVKIKLHNKKAVSGFTALNRTAQNHLGTRYVFGGTTPRGFDCSGFTQYVYQKSLGVTLPRTAQAQYNGGQHVTEAMAKKGDLVFFGANRNAISHVGIYLGNGKMIDAQSSGVKVESIHANWWKLAGFAHYID